LDYNPIVKLVRQDEEGIQAATDQTVLYAQQSTKYDDDENSANQVITPLSRRQTDAFVTAREHARACAGQENERLEDTLTSQDAVYSVIAHKIYKKRIA
jgi:hypothetical protein